MISSTPWFASTTAPRARTPSSATGPGYHARKALTATADLTLAGGRHVQAFVHDLPDELSLDVHLPTLAPAFDPKVDWSAGLELTAAAAIGPSTCRPPSRSSGSTSS